MVEVYNNQRHVFILIFTPKTAVQFLEIETIKNLSQVLLTICFYCMQFTHYNLYFLLDSPRFLGPPHSISQSELVMAE